MGVSVIILVGRLGYGLFQRVWKMERVFLGREFMRVFEGSLGSLNEFGIEGFFGIVWLGKYAFIFICLCGYHFCFYFCSWKL